MNEQTDVIAAFNRRTIPDDARETIWTAADGWEIRRLDWDAGDDSGKPPRGSILFFPGRGDLYEKYLETFHHFHLKGWNVTSSDWRGQAGSGRYGSTQHVGHIADFAMWVEDLRTFFERWKASTPGPHIVMGHSMGGHIVARALIENAIAPDAAVLIAPMLSMKGPPIPIAVSHMFAKLMTKLGNPARPAWRVSEKPASPLAIRQTLLTSDNDRYADELYWWGKRPELVMGPGSWQWVERAYASTRLLHVDGGWESVEQPVMIVATTEDKLVGYKSTASAAERIPRAETKIFGAEAKHEILREVDAVRDEALAAIDDFLDRQVSAPE